MILWASFYTGHPCQYWTLLSGHFLVEKFYLEEGSEEKLDTGLDISTLLMQIFV